MFVRRVFSNPVNLKAFWHKGFIFLIQRPLHYIEYVHLLSFRVIGLGECGKFHPMGRLAPRKLTMNLPTPFFPVRVPFEKSYAENEVLIAKNYPRAVSIGIFSGLSLGNCLRVGLEKASTISVSCEASCEHADVGDGYPGFC